MTVCKFFLQGTCNFGNRCKFEHPRDGGGNFTRTINNDDYGSATPRRFGSSRDGSGGSNYYNNETNYNRPSLANRLGGAGGGDGGYNQNYAGHQQPNAYTDDMSVDGSRPGAGSSVHDRLGSVRRGGGDGYNDGGYQPRHYRPRNPRYDNDYNPPHGYPPRGAYRPRFSGGGAGDGYYNRPSFDSRPLPSHPTHTPTPQRQAFDSFGNAGSTPEELCRIVADDVRDWNSSKTMWPLSSYAFAWSDAATSSRQNVPIFGFTDISPEEVRFAYKETYSSVLPSDGPSKPLGAAELQQEASKLPPDAQQKLIEVMRQYETGLSNEVHKSNVIKDEILRRLKVNPVDADIVREVKQERSLVANPFRQLALSLQTVAQPQQPVLSLSRRHPADSNYFSSNNSAPFSSSFPVSTTEQFPAPIRVQTTSLSNGNVDAVVDRVPWSLAAAPTASSFAAVSQQQPVRFENSNFAAVPIFADSISVKNSHHPEQNDILHDIYLLPTYTAKSEELSESDRHAYAADKFDINNLPSRPPTADMCR